MATSGTSSKYSWVHYTLGVVVVLAVLAAFGAYLLNKGNSTTAVKNEVITPVKTEAAKAPVKAETPAAPAPAPKPAAPAPTLSAELQKLADLGKKAGVEYYYSNDLHCFRFPARLIAPDSKMGTWVRDAATAAAKEGLTLERVTHVTLFSKDGKSFTSSIVEFNGKDAENNPINGAGVLVKQDYTPEEVAVWAQRTNESLAALTARPAPAAPLPAPAAPTVITRPLFEISGTR